MPKFHFCLAVLAIIPVDRGGLLLGAQQVQMVGLGGSCWGRTALLLQSSTHGQGPMKATKQGVEGGVGEEVHTRLELRRRQLLPLGLLPPWPLPARAQRLGTKREADSHHKIPWVSSQGTVSPSQVYGRLLEVCHGRVTVDGAMLG